jgi:spore maturation protein CgeB
VKITYIRPAERAERLGVEALVPHAPLAELRLRGHDVELLTDADVVAAPDGDVARSDVVLVGEACARDAVGALGDSRRSGGAFRLLFHDGGIRSAVAPAALHDLPLEAYDAILVASRAAAANYRSFGVEREIVVWREGVDVWRLRPVGAAERRGIVSFSDWGEAQRGEELVRMLLRPAREAELPLTLVGRDYPDEVDEKLAAAGVERVDPMADHARHGLIGESLAAVELPPAAVRQSLPGMVTATMLETLACGTPLIVGQWEDLEGLFAPGEHLLVAADPEEMTRHLRRLSEDDTLRHALSTQGRLAILAHHSASHRADELIALIDRLPERTVSVASEESEKVAGEVEPPSDADVDEASTRSLGTPRCPPPSHVEVPSTGSAHSHHEQD